MLRTEAFLANEDSYDGSQQDFSLSMNDEFVVRSASDAAARVNELAGEDAPAARKIETLFSLAFARKPSPRELELASVMDSIVSEASQRMDFEDNRDVEVLEEDEFKFHPRVKVSDFPNIFGWNRREPFLTCDYWADICKDCRVIGDIIEDKRVN